MDDPHDNEEDFDDPDEDFSLELLSRAYAEVMREKPPTGADDSSSKTDAAAAARQNEHAGDDQAVPKIEPVSADVKSFAQHDASEAKSDNAACPLTPQSIIEAILFVGAPRGTSLKISQIASELRDVTEEEVVQHIADLNRTYQQEKCAYQISVDQDSVQMHLVKELASFQNEFFGRNKQFQLSQPAIDVLAVVAYNQPVTKEQVDSSRGKSSGSILAQLVRRNLLVLDRDQPTPAQRTYATTDRFLELFHLTSIQDLPQSHDVSEFEEYIDD